MLEMYSLGTSLVATKLDIVLVQDTRQNIFQVAASLLSGTRANNAADVATMEGLCRLGPTARLTYSTRAQVRASLPLLGIGI